MGYPEISRFHSQRRSPDVTRAVILRLKVKGEQAYDTFWHFDTDGDPQPEFYANRNSDSGPRKVLLSRQIFGHARCSPRSVKLSKGGTVLRAKFRLRCLQDNGVRPNRVRFRVVTAGDDFNADCAPGPRQGCSWSGWVNAG